MAGHRKRRIVAVLAGGVIAVSLAACNPKTGTTTTTANPTTLPKVGATNATLHVGSTQAAFAGLNPFNPQSNVPLLALYDSLLRLKADGSVEANLAKSWEVRGKVVTLTIRAGAKFPDGTAEDAAAVQKSLDYGIAHGQGTNLGSSCYAYLSGSKTELVGSDQVKLTLAQVTPGILQQLAQCNGWIVNPKSLSNPSALDNTPDPTGPYTLDKAKTVAGHTYAFDRRGDYWNKNDYSYKSIIWTFYSSNTALNNAAKSGQVDLTGQIFDPTDTGTGLTLFAGTPDEFRGVYLMDVTGKIVKPLGDVRVRQALQHAIDRKAITKALYGPKAISTAGIPTRPGYLGYSASLADTYPYDPAKAKALLTEAGYPDGFSMTVLTDAPNEKSTQAIAGYLKKVGVTMTLSVHSSDFITQMFAGKFPAVSGNFTLNPAQYETISAIIGPNAFWNPLKNSNVDFNSALKKLSTMDPTDSGAADIYTDLNKKIAEQGWFLNPTIVPTVFGVNTKTTAVTPVSGMIFPPYYLIKPTNTK